MPFYDAKEVNKLKRSRDVTLNGQGGMTLIEVIVAMMVFALVSLGVAYSMTSVLAMTSDSRGRVAAANLAAGEIDLVRSYEDVFAVLDRTTVETVGGIKYTVDRSTSWVSTLGTDVSCDKAGGTLQYKRINVTVTWEGKRHGTKPVRTDTLLTPGSRINDPLTGTILVSVKAASGSGNPDVSVTAVPTSDGGAITHAAPLTDADGCSYLLQVKPGTYDVKVEKSGNVDLEHEDEAKLVATVKKGESTSVAFAYDLAANYALNYVPTPAPMVPIPGANLLVPTNLDVSFLSTYNPFVKLDAGNSVPLFPWPSGYQAIAGAYASSLTEKPCTVVDPAAWPIDTTSTPNRQGARLEAESAAPGDVADVNVPVGAIDVVGSATTNKTYLFAKRHVTAGTGMPSCDTPVTYKFGQVVPKSKTSISVALPYGKWTLYTTTNENGTNSKTDLDSNRLTVRTSGTVDTSKIVTLDPRVPSPIVVP